MPSTSVAEEKVELRKKLCSLTDRLSPRQHADSDAALFSHFLSLPQLADHETILLYYGVGPEPDTSLLFPQLLAMGKQIALPRCLPKRKMELRLYCPDTPLIPSSYHIPEPSPDCPLVDKSKLGLALIPALCFDRSGHRLGHGGGYYDRWLSDFTGFTVGLCRNCLLADRLPTDCHDLAVDTVITETHLFSRE